MLFSLKKNLCYLFLAYIPLISLPTRAFADSTGISVTGIDNSTITNTGGIAMSYVLHLMTFTAPSYTPNCGSTGALMSQQFIPNQNPNVGSFYYFCGQPYTIVNRTAVAYYGPGGTISNQWQNCQTNSAEICTTKYTSVPVTGIKIGTCGPQGCETNGNFTITNAESQNNPTVASVSCNGSGSCSCGAGSSCGSNTYQFSNNSNDSSSDGYYPSTWMLNITAGTWNVSASFWRNGGYTGSCSGQVTINPSNIGQTCEITCCGNQTNGEPHYTFSSVCFSCG